MKAIAIIPARGGSKRIPRKNIRNFLGKPIIAYTIEATLASGCFDEVMVSTDDQEIADIAAEYGAAIPFLRSVKNSGDYATTADVISEVMLWYKTQRAIEFQFFCCVYPTAPFITADKLRRAEEQLLQNNADSVITVAPFSFPVLRALIIEGGQLHFQWPEYMLTRSQDLKPAYHDCGQFYFVRTANFLETGKLFTGVALPFIINEMEMQDIDSETDWKLAELKYKLLHDNVEAG